MKDKRINPRLIELANKTYNPNLAMPDLEKITKKQTNQLKRDENGRPIIKLTPLEETAVNTPTQESYNTLMQVYECGGWKWVNGDLPTSGNLFWKSNKEKTCVRGENEFAYGTKDNYKESWEILPTQEFYNKQNITDDMIKEINEYFESKK